MKHLLPALLLFALSASAQNHFPNLSSITLDTFFHARFGYEASCTRIVNTLCYRLDPKDPFYCPDSTFSGGRVVAKYKSPLFKDSLTILFDPGMSDDPEFSLLTKSQKVLGRVSAVELYINAAGVVYSAGHVNNMYNRKRKFQIGKDTLQEVKQPYNYVGLKGKTLKDIVLHQQKSGSDAVVARLPKGYEVEILLTDAATPDYQADLFYLVKTDFGLVGWLRLSQEDVFGGVLEGLYFRGD